MVLLHIRGSDMMSDKGSRESIRNNKGVSLIELVISIAIIGIMLLPILNSFVIAARANSESRNVQAENDHVQNIMEEMKGRNLEDIINEYNIIGDECYEAGLSATGTGYDLYQTNPYNIKNCYYLLRRNIDNKYDALVTLDARGYLNSPGPSDTDYNRYRMPLVREVNSSDHLVAIQSYETEMAVSVLYSNHVSYLAGVDVDPLDITDVMNSIERTIRIDISQSAGNIHGAVELVYSSSVVGCGSVSYQLEAKNLNSSDEGIYVFYQAYHTDYIDISNSSGHEIDVFIYEQTATLTAIPITLPTTVKLYSNLPGYEAVKKEEAKNRIFDISVQLFNTSDDFDFADVYIPGEPYVQLQSTRGE